MTVHVNDFSARLARIEANGAKVQQRLFVGADESYLIPKKASDAPAQSEALSNAAYPATAVLAMLWGGVAFWVIKLLRWHLTHDAPIGQEPLNTFAVELLLAFALSLTVGRWIWQDHMRLRSVQAMGALIMSLTWHNLVHLAPELFNRIFSEMWTAGVLFGTDFRTIVIRGFEIPF